MRKLANYVKGGVSHCVLEGSDASHQGSLATLEGRLLNFEF